MLNVLRKKENMRVILWIICVIIIVTFVFFGTKAPMFNQGASPYAGIVFGEKVSNEDYAKSYRACYNQALMLYGGELPKVIEHLNLKMQAWERIILVKEADIEHIQVTDDEVRSRIVTIFGGPDKFNKEQYELTLAQYFNTTPRAFEEEIRNSLKISKLLENLTSNITISDEEVLEMYKTENEKVKAAYITIDPVTFTSQITPDETALEVYYNENKDLFKTQPKINVEYIAIKTDSSLDKTEVSQEEIENYYQSHKEDFALEAADESTTPQYKTLEEVKGDIKTGLQRQQAKELALDAAVIVEQQTADGEELEVVAQKNGLEIKETGLFSASESIPEIGWNFQFLQAAFNLKEGEISEIVEMPDGYYILRLKEIKTSYIPEYAEIEEGVKQSYIVREAIELAKMKAIEYQADFKNQMATGKNFKDIAKSLDLPVEETDFFSYADYVQGVGKVAEFNEAAFTLKKNQVSNVIPTSKYLIILTPEDKTSIDEKQFEKDKEEFSKKALEMKQAEIFQTWFSNLLEKADLKNNIQ